MPSNIKNKIFIPLFIFTVLLFITAGCTGGFGLRKIASVPPEDMITLSAGGPHGGRWQTQDLIIAFEYTTNSNAHLTAIIKSNQDKHE